MRTREGPVRVENRQLEAIRRLVGSDLCYGPLSDVQLGDEVEIIVGSLQGCRGRLLRKDGGGLALLNAAVNGGARVSLPDSSWARRVGRVPAVMTSSIGSQPYAQSSE